MDNKKQYDYDAVIRNIDSMSQVGHVDSLITMIKLFDIKWKEKNQHCDLPETIELFAILKYKQNHLNLYENLK